VSGAKLLKIDGKNPLYTVLINRQLKEKEKKKIEKYEN
jgi:hypothetical protein